MKKLMLLIASTLVVLTSLAVPVSVMADGNPAPWCSNGQPCRPVPPTQ